MLGSLSEYGTLRDGRDFGLAGLTIRTETHERGCLARRGMLAQIRNVDVAVLADHLTDAWHVGTGTIVKFGSDLDVGETVLVLAGMVNLHTRDSVGQALADIAVPIISGALFHALLELIPGVHTDLGLEALFPLANSILDTGIPLIIFRDLATMLPGEDGEASGISTST